MNPTFLMQVILVLTPVIVAAEADLDAFRRAKKKDPVAEFDGMIFVVRILKALVVGLAAASGAPAVVGAPA